MSENSAVALSDELPTYQCHKTVRAGKIVRLMAPPTGHPTGSLWLDGFKKQVVVPAEYFAKHRPTQGGYYVLYEDGYESFSPAAPFERGYELVPKIGA